MPRSSSSPGRRSRNKGKRGEREIASLFRAAGWNARRSQQFCGSPDGGAADVLVDAPHWIFHIESKYVQATDIYRWMRQAVADARGGKIPVVCHRRNNESWHVTMRISDWLELVRQALPYSQAPSVVDCKGIFHTTSTTQTTTQTPYTKGIKP